MKRSRTPIRPLPDDIIFDILSRLPADHVRKFRSVCRRWKALISSQYFAEMHLKANTFPAILVQETGGSLLLIDKWEPSRKRTRIRKLCINSMPSEHRCFYSFGLSYDGLIALKGWAYGQNFTNFIIFNPITGDKVSIISRIPGGEKGEIYGIFFHPEIKEYCIIWGWFEYGLRVQFKMLSLGSQPCWRDLKPPSPWVHKPRIYGAAPVVIDDDATLYWMVGSRYNHAMHHFHEHPSCGELIMAFDIKMEQFIVMPHPGPTTEDCRRRHLNMNILKMDSRLSFVHIASTDLSVIINIWTLEDSATRFWIKSHNVSIDQCLRHAEWLTQEPAEWLREGELRAMAVGNGELLLQFSRRFYNYDKRFYACNFELGTIRKFGRTYRYVTDMCAHVPTFASLKNCKSEILMEESLEHE